MSLIFSWQCEVIVTPEVTVIPIEVPVKTGEIAGQISKTNNVYGKIEPKTYFTREDVLAAPTGLRHESAIRLIFQKEIGGVGYNPYALHMQRECYGPGGLCSFGLLNEFTRWATQQYGIADRYNPYQVAKYIEWVLDNGRNCNWPYLC